MLTGLHMTTPVTGHVLKRFAELPLRTDVLNSSVLTVATR